MPQSQVQPIGNTTASPKTGESNNLSQEPLDRGQISSNPWQRPSLKIVSSRNLDRSALPLLKLKMVQTIKKGFKVLSILLLGDVYAYNGNEVFCIIYVIRILAMEVFNIRLKKFFWCL